MARWTPGPWKAVLHFGDWAVRQDPKNWDGNGYQHIAALPASRKGSHYGDMFAANARLIAAAPALLSALKTARGIVQLDVDSIIGDGEGPRRLKRTLAKIDSAIRKATDPNNN